MGTSKPYSAPTTPPWAAWKRELTRAARAGSPTEAMAARLLRDYIAANGGAASLASGGGVAGGGRAAQRVARHLGRFVAAIGTAGFQAALRQAGLAALAGRPVSEVVYALLAYLGGPASTIDEVDARNALSRLLNELLAEAADFAAVARIMEAQAQGAGLERLLRSFFGYYLYEQFCRVAYERLATRVGEAQAEQFLPGILDYIQAVLHHETLHRDIHQIDWSGEEGRSIADQILAETLAVFGGSHAG